MTNTNLKELLLASQMLRIQSKREELIKGIIIDFISSIKDQYPDKTNDALSTIVKTKLRYGMSRPDSFYAYLKSRLSNVSYYITESMIYSLRDEFTEFSFDYLDSIVNLYFLELAQKENLLRYSQTIAGRASRTTNNSNATSGPTDANLKIETLSKYSKYLWIGGIAVLVLLILRR